MLQTRRTYPGRACNSSTRCTKLRAAWRRRPASAWCSAPSFWGLGLSSGACEGPTRHARGQRVWQVPALAGALTDGQRVELGGVFDTEAPWALTGRSEISHGKRPWHAVNVAAWHWCVEGMGRLSRVRHRAGDSLIIRPETETMWHPAVRVWGCGARWARVHLGEPMQSVAPWAERARHGQQVASHDHTSSVATGPEA